MNKQQKARASSTTTKTNRSHFGPSSVLLKVLPALDVVSFQKRPREKLRRDSSTPRKRRGLSTPPAAGAVFDGAHSVPTFRDLGECAKCRGKSFFASNFVKVEEITLEVVYKPTSPATIAAADIKNILENKGGRDTDPDRGGREGRVFNICWQCLGTEKCGDSERFVRIDPNTGKKQVTSSFHNLRKRKFRNGAAMDPATIKGLYLSAIVKHPEFEVQLQNAMAIALASPCVNVAPNMYITRKCSRCLECPILGRTWVRGRNNWYCPSSACHKKQGICKKHCWSGEKNHSMVLIMPTDDRGYPKTPKMTAVILGQCDKEDEATLTLIKRARLISSYSDKYGKERQLTWRHIVAAIRQLEDKPHKVIIRSDLKICLRTAITKKEFDDMCCQRNCTHPSFSLSQWGET